MSHKVNIKGQKFGRLTAINDSGKRQQNQIVWECLCDCGNTTFAKGNHLRKGKIQSCGCLKKEKTILRFTKHGKTNSPEYLTWKRIRQRCSPKNVYRKDYYDRGIKVCQEWLGKGGFEKFFSEIGPRPTKDHTIDRINNDKGYEPGNVRWATMKEQRANQRKRVRIEQFTDAELYSELIKRSYREAFNALFGKAKHEKA